MTLHKTILSVLLISTLVVPHGAVFAISEPAEEVFNPNFILSDPELQDWKSMNRPDIQAFLEDHDSYLAHYKTEDAEGKKRKASDIIFRAAVEHNINPKYILVKLQKEQSLIDDDNPSQKRLDWATGYGVCDSCKTTDPNIQKFKGFGVQVDKAAGVMRWYYDNVETYGYIKKAGVTYTIDNETVVPANLATAFLYTYTPHIHGNQNFWKLWQKWFDQVYPEGTLLKTADNATIYVLQNDTLRPFANMSALTTRFDPKLVVTVPASELSRYTIGESIALPNFSILKKGSTYYLVDYNTLRPFDESVRAHFGYNPQEVIDVSSDDIAAYTIGTALTKTNTSPLGDLVKVIETGDIYFLKDNQYHPIIDEEIAHANFPHLSAASVAVSSLGSYQPGVPVLFKDGTLFGVEGSNKIYVVENQKKRHIATEEVYNALGYDWANIIWVNFFAGEAHPTGQPLYMRGALTNIAETKEKQDEGEKNTVMQRTTKENTVYEGPQFDTEIDAYLVADYDTLDVLAGKNMDVVRPIASLTKVMTAYRLLKEGLNMNSSITYDESDHRSAYHRFRLVDGERFRAKDLMDAMLVSSLNTPARMLVDKVESHEPSFIARMNNEADSLGLTKTNFDGVTGLSEKTVSTAREYATLFKKATQGKTLNTLLSTQEYEYTELTDIDEKPDHFDDHTNMIALESHDEFRVLASKTGYIHESGATLAMIVERTSDKKKFIIITFGDPRGHFEYYQYHERFIDSRAITEWAVENF